MIGSYGAVQHGGAGPGQADNKQWLNNVLFGNLGKPPEVLLNPQAGGENIQQALAQDRATNGILPGLVLQRPAQLLERLAVAVIAKIIQAIYRPGNSNQIIRIKELLCGGMLTHYRFQVSANKDGGGSQLTDLQHPGLHRWVVASPDITEQHGAHPVPCRGEPVGVMASGRRMLTNQDTHTAVDLGDGTVVIDANAVIAVIERLHPVIGQLKVPGPALPGRSELNKQSLIFRQPPVTVVIVNSRITPGTQAHLLVIGGQLIKVSTELIHPLLEKPRSTTDERHHLRQLPGKMFGI